MGVLFSILIQKVSRTNSTPIAYYFRIVEIISKIAVL
jgi:hypothetical protein